MSALPSLVLKNGHPIASSLAVAADFGKKHYNVLRDIKNLECSEEFAKLNFELCYENNELQNGKPQPFYTMTRDGFTFLAMGFTGKEAAQWKEKYIAAFNAMEARLREQPLAPAPVWAGPLVCLDGGRGVVTSLSVAAGAGVPHDLVAEAAGDAAAALAHYGPVPSRPNPVGGGGHLLFGQEQAAVLMTFLPDGAEARAFARRLTLAFHDFNRLHGRHRHCLGLPRERLAALLDDSERDLAAEKAARKAAEAALREVRARAAEDPAARPSPPAASMSLSEAAVALGVGRRTLARMLECGGWAVCRDGRLAACPDAVGAGLVEDRGDLLACPGGEPSERRHVRVTRRGLARLEGIFREERKEAARESEREQARRECLALAAGAGLAIRFEDKGGRRHV